MTRASLLLLIVVAASLSACSQGDQAPDWLPAWQDHEEHQQVDLAVAEAINEPGGGDYARAVAITRASNRSTATKNYEVGQLIVGSFDRVGSRRPAETLQQGLHMMEQAAVQPWESQEYVPQQLRFIFESGIGTPPKGIPIDRPVAECWHRLETWRTPANGRAGTPAQCVALRRQRLPQLSV